MNKVKTFEDEFDDDDDLPEPTAQDPHISQEQYRKKSHKFLNEVDPDESFRYDEEDSPDHLGGDSLVPYSGRYDLVPKVDYDFEQFMPVQEVTDDVKTTESDLAMLNNSMAVMDAALKKVVTVDSAKKIVETMIKLIECRRKVKKLQYGSGSVLLKAERGYEVLE